MGTGNGRVGIAGRFPRFHKSTWSYIGWALLYAGLWSLPSLPSSPRKIFAEILGVDFIVNTTMPFFIGGAGLASLLFTRKGKKPPWFVWIVTGGTALASVLASSAIVFKAGGGLVLAGTILFLSRLGWFYRRTGKGREIGVVFARGLFGPWLFMLPALVISGTVVGRRTLGFENLDWVPLFGMIYFGTQAAFEEFILRLIERPPKKGAEVR